MDTTTEQIVDYLCRTCMHELGEVITNDVYNKSGQEWHYISNKTEEYGSLLIIEMLASAIPQINMSSNEKLPNKICSKCLEQLHTTYRFQQMCVQTDQQIRELISNGNVDLKVAETDATAHKTRTNEILVQESLQAETDQETSQSSGADPLQSVGEAMEEVVVSDYVKTELSYEDASYGEYRDKEVALSADTMKSDVNTTVEKESKQKKLPHSKRQSKKKKTGFACDTCDRIFNTSKKLKEHQNKHTGARPYLCPECGKSFSCESHLKQHVERHGPPDAFECPLCPRKFCCKNDVYKHKVIHFQIKKHICDICGVGFIKTHQLAAHKRYHNPVKPYKCDYCDMRFVSKYNNRSHMRTHTGEKPWKCKYCENTFARSSDYMAHLRIHIGSKNVYRCDLCPDAFRLATQLREHIVIHKHEDEETREQNMKALKEAEADLLLKIERQRIQQEADDGSNSKNSPKPSKKKSKKSKNSVVRDGSKSANNVDSSE